VNAVHVLVLGGTGKIGRLVIEQLLAGGHQVTALVRTPQKLTTPSIPDPRDRPTIKAKVLPVMAKLMFPGALAELRGMTAAVTGSDLDWTIARITSRTARPAHGPRLHRRATEPRTADRGHLP
jgi:NAD(P)-dependent dehydrogenase (short-subunit alcohol dehydrogenase family)